MNKSLDILKAIYKPYRYTIKGNVTFIETTSGNFIIKEKKKDVKKLFNYLKSRNFNNYPPLIDGNRKDVNVYSYIEKIDMPKEQMAQDIIHLLADLHTKTSYFKEISENHYKTIYEDINSNINYLKHYYNSKYDTYFNEIYTSPSHYLLLRNYYKINEVLIFCETELNNWYELIKKEKKIRVSVVHNNISLDHFIKNDKDYLISWDNYKIDTPILDIVSFYKNEYINLNFEELLNQYLNNFNLYEYEKKLLFILILLPPVVKEELSEFNNTKKMEVIFDYIFKTDKLIMPYYSNNEEEKQS